MKLIWFTIPVFFFLSINVFELMENNLYMIVRYWLAHSCLCFSWFKTLRDVANYINNWILEPKIIFNLILFSCNLKESIFCSNFFSVFISQVKHLKQNTHLNAGKLYKFRVLWVKIQSHMRWMFSRRDYRFNFISLSQNFSIGFFLNSLKISEYSSIKMKLIRRRRNVRKRVIGILFNESFWAIEAFKEKVLIK